MKNYLVSLIDGINDKVLGKVSLLAETPLAALDLGKNYLAVKGGACFDVRLIGREELDLGYRRVILDQWDAARVQKIKNKKKQVEEFDDNKEYGGDGSGSLEI